jgi:hypothetical protein
VAGKCAGHRPDFHPHRQPKVLDSAFMQFAREDPEMEKALLVIFVFFVQYIIFNI